MYTKNKKNKNKDTRTYALKVLSFEVFSQQKLLMNQKEKFVRNVFLTPKTHF